MLSMNSIKSFEINQFDSREERHHCAYLFKWLLDRRENVENFLGAKIILGKDYRLFYEYTPVREYLYSLKKQDIHEYNRQKIIFDQQLVNFATPSEQQTNDIQKKKIDLAIQTQINGHTMVYLIEAKFEECFDKKQLELTENYGKILQELFGVEYHIILLGMQYHLKKSGLEKYPNVSWEGLVSGIDDEIVKEEIKKGLEYQYEIHPRTKPIIVTMN
jgi:hypothetical protein